MKKIGWLGVVLLGLVAVCGAAEVPFRVLFLGNSITRHGVADWLEWNHEAGMAASTEESDYVHLFCRELAARLNRPVEPLFHTFGGAVAGRLATLGEYGGPRPDLVVVQLGESENATAIADGSFAQHYGALLDQAAQLSSTGEVIAFGPWNPHRHGEIAGYEVGSATMESIMRQAALRRNLPFCSVERYALDSKCTGYGTNPGVAWHPNDAGMRGYADELLAAWERLRAAAATGFPVAITVDAVAVIGEANPLLLGHNLEAADPRGIFTTADDPNFHVPTIRQGQGTWDAEQRRPFPAVMAELRKHKLSALRYPGGCLSHNFDWRRAVGPLVERGMWQFGLDEYIAVCRELGAEPVITVTDYALPAADLPQHAADLVEYLNAPATKAYPWALKRAEMGHPEPYGVRYFELGNESDHGNHEVKPGRRFTPEQYADYFLTTAAAMRRIDPTIQLGIWLGYEPGAPWAREVLTRAGHAADFAVIHCYAPPLYAANGSQVNTQAAGSYGDILQRYISAFQQDMTECLGRTLPLAVTEYNVNHAENWRYSFLGGLIVADLLQVLTRPENQVFLANYWHILNDFWGPLHTGYRDEITRRHAVNTIQEAIATSWEPELVQVAVETPRLESPAVGEWAATAGDAVTPGHVTGSLPLGDFIMTELNTAGVKPTVTAADGLTLDFDRRDHSAYMNFAVVHRPADEPADQPMHWRFSYEARFLPTPGYTGQAAMGLGLVDQRGWDATLSGLAVRGAEATTDWQPFSGFFVSRSDSPGVFVVARLEMVDQPVSGRLEFRKIRLEPWAGAVNPAYRAVESVAMRSTDGKRLSVLVFNKSADQAALATLTLNGFAATSGEFSELYRNDVGDTGFFEPVRGQVAVDDGRVERALPPHSLTIFEFRAE